MEFPTDGDANALAAWFKYHNFTVQLPNWDSWTLLHVKKKQLLNLIPGPEGLRLWSYLEPFRPPTPKKTNDQKSYEVLKRIERKLDQRIRDLQDLTRTLVAMHAKQPRYTSSQLARMHAQFKKDSIARYHAANPTSPNYIKCSVLGAYIGRGAVQAGHLCRPEQSSSLALLGEEQSFVWDARNCVLMYYTIQQKFDAMEITFLRNPYTHMITLQVLYDDVLDQRVVTDFTAFEGYADMSKGEKRRFRARCTTFAALNGRPLEFPPLTYPNEAVLDWCALSAYTKALESFRPHEFANLSMPSAEQWGAMMRGASPVAATNLRFQLGEPDLASASAEEGWDDSEREEESDSEDDKGVSGDKVL